MTDMKEALDIVGEPLPMEPELWAAGCDPETAKFAARMLREKGYFLVRPEDLNMEDIERFRAELSKGQGIYEDSGGFFVRAIVALFGGETRIVTNFRDAVNALLASTDQSQRHI